MQYLTLPYLLKSSHLIAIFYRYFSIKLRKPDSIKQFIYIFNEHYVSVVSDQPKSTVFANKNKNLKIAGKL